MAIYSSFLQDILFLDRQMQEPPTSLESRNTFKEEIDSSTDYFKSRVHSEKKAIVLV